ncbi:hypothetical protein B0A69_18690 [Chryseobacterium shigense]|uniref:DUF3575 domain-containing protein n=1 Tax=Chryseobacterium shigense TaxID=297244 RepID=A0A1N7K4C5_9FLAO|nr:DUF3575 domain-containing protein [Chryseobacterium shigense]PQA91106.1 hypothetical protein B0A69_18690 [Chryseobacterium shigense]SIS56455.1 Protein of unknown function [Chryseobacterium shigense]
MLKHKFLTTSITLLSLGMLTAQEQEQEKGLYIKGNALLAPIGVINIGLEKQITSKITIQGDVLVSPWKSFAGHEFQYYSLSLEGRYYFNQAFTHWYVGANVAASAFVLQKWNYWNDNPYINDRNEVFTSSNLYQKGVSFILGVTGGYQFKVSDRLNIDVYATIGSSSDFYKGYDRTTGQRYESAQKYNKSGEILPYRGGVMISYKLK